jgi:hypothetical protein
MLVALLVMLVALLVMLVALLVLLLVMLALLAHALSPPLPPPALLLQLWVAGRVTVAAAAAQEAVSSISSAAPGAADARTSCGLVVRLVRVLVFEEASESTPEESEASGGWRPGTQAPQVSVSVLLH